MTDVDRGPEARAETPAGRAEPAEPSAAEALDALRGILVPEAEEIERVARKVDGWRVTAGDLTPVLPQALAEEARRGTLGRALQPTVEDAIETSVRKKPQRIVDAIFPIIGPAIRKSVAEALRSMTENLNRILEQSLSVQSIGWRIEAARTGRPFAEIALSHSLVWRVEHVLLVHRETGLCMARASSHGLGVLDGDAVSGMLVALQDYVRTSFGQGDESRSGELSNVGVGERVVWVDRGPHAAIAAVIHGSPPADLHQVFQDTLAEVHAVGGERLAEWRGDPDPSLESLSEYLEDALLVQKRTGGSKARGNAVLVVAAFALAMVPVLWFFHRKGVREQWDAYRAAIAAEPGLLVMSTEEDGGELVLDLLRDPLARDPRAVLAEVQDPPGRVRWTVHPYQSLDPPLVLARARALLAPPPGASLDYADGVLTVRAAAHDEWLDRARERAAFLAGVEELRVEIAGGAGR